MFLAPIVTGGTGLHLRALPRGRDPASAARPREAFGPLKLQRQACRVNSSSAPARFCAPAKDCIYPPGNRLFCIL